jgi:ABC-type Fe3+/spermidine/putrescine transport system ATPase subunit
MFQGNALFDSMTVYENVATPIRETMGLSKAEIDRRVMTRIEQAELVDAAQKYPSQISGGMQKRVALARALITDPQIVLFDEPTTGLDPVRKNAILSMIAQYQKNSVSLRSWSATRSPIFFSSRTEFSPSIIERSFFKEHRRSSKSLSTLSRMRFSKALKACRRN